MIVSLYITVRGFSFATACVERYKREINKVLQKGKGIRKEVFTSTATENITEWHQFSYRQSSKINVSCLFSYV